MLNSVEDFKNLLSKDAEYDESVELTYISRLFSNYLFRMLYKNSTNTVDYSTVSIFCHLLFTGT